MADEQHTVRSVSWNEVFGFSHVFKSFKMAIHPSKILLALAAIAITWVLGVFVMDPIWSGASDANRVQVDEAWELWTTESRGLFLQEKDKWLKEGRASALADPAVTYQAYEKLADATAAAREDFDEVYEKVEKGIASTHEKAVEDAQKKFEAEEERIEKLPKAERKDALKKAKQERLADEQKALEAYILANAQLRQKRGGRIFASFLDWQSYCIHNAVSSVLRGRFTAGLMLLARKRGSMTPAEYRQGPGNRPPFVEPPKAAGMDAENYGLLAWLVMMGWGVCWMFCAYPLYAIIYVVIALAIWSILGGAICRIAALHAAREEKISAMAALKFSFSKFPNFFGAPLLPVAFIIVLGLCLALAGVVGSIRYVGEWLYALLFFLPLVAGAFIAFLLVGLVGGWPLMWPTIAVEGSDGFDALSRSFSYIFARPFRYGLYWLVATVYGTICYLTVRLFAFIGLRAIHCWSGWAMSPAGRDQYALGASKLDVMWAKPTFTAFHGPWQWEAMNSNEKAAAAILGLWVLLVSGVVLAFLACFLFSAATNIYFLLRRLVDATDLDDVYVEEAEEEFAPVEEAPAEEAVEEAPPEQPPAEEKPPRKRPSRKKPEEEGGEEEEGG